jgi:exopolysaccharide biosynthesis polyprenyl glycosylphosphotransferase
VSDGNRTGKVNNGASAYRAGPTLNLVSRAPPRARATGDAQPTADAQAGGRSEPRQLGPFRLSMPTPRDSLFRRSLALADLIAAAGGLAVLKLVTGDGLERYSLATVPLMVLIMKVGGRYDRDDVVLRKSTLDEAPACAAMAGAFALAWSLVTIVLNLPSHRADVVVLWAATAALVLSLRASARLLAGRVAPPERILILGGSYPRQALGRRLSTASERIEVVGLLPLEDERRTSGDRRVGDRRRADLSVEDLAHVVKELEIDRVILVPTSATQERMLDAIAIANHAGVKVSIVPRILEAVGSAVEFDEVGGLTLLGVRRSGLSRSSAMVKRSMDIVGSALGVIAVAPVGLLIALAIKLDSPGPVFYRQTRIGRGGKAFQMIKFRSMVDHADEQRGALAALNESEGTFKLSRDPRATRVGRLLRRSSLDELPQLVNVLRGEMSLVGPRPLLPEEDELVEGRGRGRLRLAPGMTGPWQVLGPTRPPLSEMVKLDYLYCANWSLWSDIKFLLRTVAHVAARRGM